MLCLNASHDTCKALDANPSGCHKIHLISISHQVFRYSCQHSHTAINIILLYIILIQVSSHYRKLCLCLTFPITPANIGPHHTSLTQANNTVVITPLPTKPTPRCQQMPTPTPFLLKDAITVWYQPPKQSHNIAPMTLQEYQKLMDSRK